MPAVEHWAAGEQDGGDVHRGRAHQHGGDGLVAAAGQHHAVERVAVQHLDQAEIGQVAVERRSGALAGLLDRMDREFERDAAGVADTVAHALRQVDQMAVAGGEVGAGLSDADDGATGLQLAEREAEVHIALEVERGHARVRLVVEPAAAAQAARAVVMRAGGGGVVGHGHASLDGRSGLAALDCRKMGRSGSSVNAPI